ncbi:MAG: META domain-containing protein [Actinomycetota bacterium]
MHHALAPLRTLLAILVVFAAAAAACGGDSGAAPPDGEWVLVELRTSGGDSSTPLGASEVELTIEPNRVFGSAGCNSFGGDASFDRDGSLRLDSVGMTEMACLDADAMAFEGRFAAVLFAVDRWERAEDSEQLELTGSAGTLVYAPRIAPPDLPLAGTTWMLDTLFDGDIAMTSVGMEDVTLVFDVADGRAAVGVHAEGPCWSQPADATVEPGGEGNLRFDRPSADAEFRCDDQAFFDEVTGALDETNAYQIEEARLTLLRGNEPLVGFRAG